MQNQDHRLQCFGQLHPIVHLPIHEYDVPNDLENEPTGSLRRSSHELCFQEDLLLIIHIHSIIYDFEFDLTSFQVLSPHLVASIDILMPFCIHKQTKVDDYEWMNSKK